MEQFKKLQEAKEVLCDDVQRKAYDYWRNSHLNVPWKTWYSMTERSQPVSIFSLYITSKVNTLKKQKQDRMQYHTYCLYRTKTRQMCIERIKF